MNSRSGERAGKFCPNHGEQSATRNRCAACGAELTRFDPSVEEVGAAVVPDFFEEETRGAVHYVKPREGETETPIDPSTFRTRTKYTPGLNWRQVWGERAGRWYSGLAAWMRRNLGKDS